MNIKSTVICIAAVSTLAACATPTELRGRQVTFAASSLAPNAQQTLTCVAKGWEQATQQPVAVSKFDKGYTAIAQSKTLFGTNTDFVIDSGNARTGGAVFQLWSTMSKDSTDQLIAIIQPCL
ncbi:MAG: hypothetical protein ACR2IJ_08960 [Fluviibacter sp.]|jgi:uncharacterized lipoprotein YajG